MMKHRIEIKAILIISIFIFSNSKFTYAQGTTAGGHPEINTQSGKKAVYAAWNFEAGKDINYREYSEFLPNLQGWDFRINLPHTKFQEFNTNRGTATTMVGVDEESASFPSGSFAEYGHSNNSIWAFRAIFTSGQVYLRYKILPSRRDVSLDNNSTENVSSLTGGWVDIPAPSGVKYWGDKPSVVVTRGWLGIKIFVFARGESGEVYYTSKTVNNATNNVWTNTWTPLNVSSLSKVSATKAFDNKIAVAWNDANSKKVEIALLDLQSFNFSTPIRSSSKATGAPQILWDGVALNLFYVNESPKILKYDYIISTMPFSFEGESSVNPLIAVKNDHFHAMVFNTRLHVLLHHDSGPNNKWGRIFYTSSKNEFGNSPQWTFISETGLTSSFAPLITSLNENIFALAINNYGKVTYSRKDPNRKGNDLVGGSFPDTWLEQATVIDKSSKLAFRSIDVLWFNRDIYLTGNNYPFGPSQKKSSCYVINFSRAFVKKFFREKLKTDLVLGSAESYAGRKTVEDENGNTVLSFFEENNIPMMGDFNGDQRDDIINFTQKKNADIGPAPVFVANAQGDKFTNHKVWHKFFSLKGEIPMVDDFNGDGKDDIITFTQQEQKYADGSVIGPAVVWVALSDGAKFGASKIWHKFFSLKGEIPMVGDFNDDGKDDIITFTQREQKYADGNVIGPAVVWVALSDGAKFGQSKIWHKFFSLKGEIPKVGDFNGDGRDDIATFVQKNQYANGQILGAAPVWVALSNGNSFGFSSVWHTFFAPKGEVPAIGDFNLDGIDDIVTFVNGAGDVEKRKHNVYVAFSTCTKFSRSVICTHLFGGADENVMTASFSGKALRNNSGISQSTRNRFFYDLISFRILQRGPQQGNGKVEILQPLSTFPMPIGAPQENYNFFTDKGLGALMFPEWIWDGADCLDDKHKFVLLGASGSASASYTQSSARSGGRQGHVIEELGHSVFANCLRSNKDPFNLFDKIYTTSLDNGGFDANAMFGLQSQEPNCLTSWCYDDRDPEHYFISIMKNYRWWGGDFRRRIREETNPLNKSVLEKQYKWLKDNWFDGVEFKGSTKDGNFVPTGFQCLNNQCNEFDSIVAQIDPGMPARGELVEHTGYVLSYNEEHEQADWVYYQLTKNEVGGTVPRKNAYRADPAVSTGSAALSDYEGSGYNRGQLAPAADMKWSTTAMRESFFLSNMSPQTPNFNQGVWKKLEAKVRKWAGEFEEVYVVTGPILAPGLKTIGENKVSVPEAYYKVILDLKSTEMKGIGFILENEGSNLSLENFVVTIDSVETLTQLDFFTALDDSLERSLESRIDKILWFRETTAN